MSVPARDARLRGHDQLCGDEREPHGEGWRAHRVLLGHGFYVTAASSRPGASEAIRQIEVAGGTWLQGDRVAPDEWPNRALAPRQSESRRYGCCDSGRGPYAGTGRPDSSAPRSGARPVKPSVTPGRTVPASTAADPAASVKSWSSGRYSRVGSPF